MTSSRAFDLVCAFGALSLAACSVFEPPITQGGRDAGDDDASSEHDASDDAAAMLDGGGDGSVVIPVPRRPELEACDFGAPTTLATVTHAALDEVSGAAASRKNPRVLWMLEDSGSAAVVYAINDLGAVVALYTVGGAAIDYEDLAIGPGPTPGVDYLYVGDIGNNTGTRTTRTVYRAPEPLVAWDQAYTTGALTSVEPLPFVFPAPYAEDNAEGLFVDPETGDVYVVTKNGFNRPNTLFVLSAPHTPAVARTMAFVGGVFAGEGTDIAITSADISADGARIVMRSLHAVNHWARIEGTSIADTILGTLPCDGVVGPTETKGESITLGATGYFTFSEGISQPLTFVPFAPE